MRKIIAAIRVVSLPLWTLFIYSIYLIVFIFIKVFGLRYESWRNMIMKVWGKVLAAIFSMEINVEGEPPEPPFFLVSNHLSYMDIIVYSYVLKTTFVSKSEIKEWPVVGFMAKTLGIIFVDRKKRSDVKRVNDLISEQLNELQGVILFPEGTTSPGAEILQFRPSLLQHAAAAEIEVSYAAIRYQTSGDDPPAHESVCWWGNTPLGRHFYLLAQNKRIYTSIKFGKQRIKNRDRKLLAAELQQKVEELFTPVVNNLKEKFEPLNF